MSKRSSSVRRFSHVLCAVDFSADSRAALRWAAAIASATEGSLTVLYVSDPMLLAAAAAGYDQRAIDESASRELSRFVAGALPAAARRRVTLATEIRRGKPAGEIGARARAGKVDLIVLGTRGLNGARRLLLGSTTATVLRQARVPVLTIPGAIGRRAGTLRWPPSRVLGALALDGHARVDAAAYAEVARLLGVPLMLLHVVPAPPVPGWYGRRGRRSDSRRDVQRTLDRLGAQHADVVDEIVVLSGDPPAGIQAAASGRAGAIILMVLRSRPGLFGSRAGAVSYEVLCRAAAPVLALPAPGSHGGRS